MKTLFAAILFSALSFGTFAQTTTKQTTTTKTTTVTKTVADSYRCPVCGYTDTKAGNCTKDKTTLVKVGDYYCPECYMTSKKAGKCSMCGVDMKKMEAATASTTKK